MKAQTPESAAKRIASAPAHYASMILGASPRFAVIRGARTVKEALAYLPVNYDLMESFEMACGVYVAGAGPTRPCTRHADHGGGHDPDAREQQLVVIIGGLDRAGWTLDGYVIPRLASGLIQCEEIPA